MYKNVFDDLLSESTILFSLFRNTMNADSINPVIKFFSFYQESKANFDGFSKPSFGKDFIPIYLQLFQTYLEYKVEEFVPSCIDEKVNRFSDIISTELKLISAINHPKLIAKVLLLFFTITILIYLYILYASFLFYLFIYLEIFF